MFGHGVGFFLFGWMIFTFLMLIASLRSSIALSGVFFFLTITFLLLGINEFVTGTHCGVAGGVFGLITAFVRSLSSAYSATRVQSLTGCHSSPFFRTRGMWPLLDC